MRAMLYGATGYTGRETAAALARSGVEVVLAGRDPDRVAAVAGPLGLPWTAFDLNAQADIDRALAGIGVVLHAAGPFTATAEPMVRGCLRAGAHYLDLGGEWPVFLQIAALDEAAQAAGVMLMPGVGLTVAATDCLLALAKERSPEAVKLRLGVSYPQVITRGTVVSIAALMEPYVVIRQAGRLVFAPSGRLWRAFDFGDGLREAAAMPYPDVVTAPLSTGVGDIAVYCEFPWLRRLGYRLAGTAMAMTGPQRWRQAVAGLGRLMPEGPAAAQRQDAGFVMVAEAEDPWRRIRRVRMSTRDGYTFSVAAAAEAVRRVLAGAARPGFETPARAFGARFALETGCAWFDDPPLAAKEGNAA
jgi:short subunit dehydrogenase-like uncharacterized protein